jgi:Family of unknown function (DUF5681)
MVRKDQSNRGEKSASDNAAHNTVGYGQPPLASRFKPGTSGNAKGRPKGRKNLRTLIKEAMTANILIQEGQNSRRVSRIEGVVLRQLQSALKGSDRAALAVIKMAHQLRFLEDSESNTAETALSPEEERILNELVARSRKD